MKCALPPQASKPALSFELPSYHTLSSHKYFICSRVDHYHSKSLNLHPNDSLKNVPAAHNVYLTQPGTEIICGERKHILFLSVESTGTFIKTFIVEVPHQISFIL